MSKLKIAIQKKGRLTEQSLSILRDCGINISNGTSKLKTQAENFPLEVLFLRDDDIPQYVEQKVADIGLLGENIVLEKQKNIRVIEKMGFAKCRLSLAVPKDEVYEDLSYFNKKRVATTYPNLLSEFFKENGISADIEEISGSVEIAPSINLADAVCDIVSSGSTLFTNNLKEVKTVLNSEAVLISNENLPAEKQQILDKLLFRLRAVKRSSEFKYIILNAPNEVVDKIADVLPGMKAPTVTGLATKGWSSMQSVIREDEFWEVIDRLKNLGAEGILVVPIEKMVL